jgi:hypothetical protein
MMALVKNLTFEIATLGFASLAMTRTQKGRFVMKWLNYQETKVLLIVFVAAIVLGGGSANADFAICDPSCMDQAINNPDNTDIQGLSLLHDGLKLYFSVDKGVGYWSHDIWVTTRESIDAPWGQAIKLGLNVSGPGPDINPAISPDDLELYFERNVNNVWRLMRSTRASKDNPWGPASEFTELGDAWDLDFAADGLTVFFTALGEQGDEDIWMATRETISAPWSDSINLGPNINDAGDQFNPSISNDNLAIFFCNASEGGISMATRTTKDGAWGTRILLGSPVNNDGTCNYNPEISPNGSILYFDSNRSSVYGGHDIWQVSINPIFDFDGNGVLSLEDLFILIETWGQDEPLCDIGPMPWGDGIIDVQDLAVLSEHLSTYLGGVACWKLDETEGSIAYDCAGENDADAFGGALWQPAGGMFGGALELDGIDDYVSTPFVLNPYEENFSVFAWIKGGATGQVIISQQNGANWLSADSSEGNLFTELKCESRSGTTLSSQTVITDGNWHRVGLTWDGTNRILYADGVKVASDTQSYIEDSEGGLYIGAGKNLEPGSLWSGLIDDVHVFNRAITP